MEILSTEPSVKVAPVPRPLPKPARGAIAFDNVTFRYPSRPDSKALHGVSFAVQPGEAVALVGPSGAGKSTMFQLLLRFFDPQDGRILFDAANIAELDPRELRGNIALVAQDPAIFSGTISENIRYGRPEASDVEIRRAAEAAASSACRKPMRPSSASTASRYPAASASASPLRGRSCATRRFCCWTRRRARWMPKTKDWCSRAWPI
jgi:ABC-type multidrug transport system fused ATPase/permease subunit